MPAITFLVMILACPVGASDPNQCDIVRTHPSPTMEACVAEAKAISHAGQEDPASFVAAFPGANAVMCGGVESDKPESES